MILLTTDDMAERLRVTPQTVRRLARQHRLPGTLRIGGQLRWPCEAIDNWLCGKPAAPRYVDDDGGINEHNKGYSG